MDASLALRLFGFKTGGAVVHFLLQEQISPIQQGSIADLRSKNRIEQ